MTVYNTSADAANTAVRAFLTMIGERYLGRSFNTAVGRAKKDLDRVRTEIFDGKCAYCGRADVSTQMDHLVMFNRSEYGLHHPGNIVPACRSCNKRRKHTDKTYMSWKEHLNTVCVEIGEEDQFHARMGKIVQHMEKEGYPSLSREERHAIRVIANSLYDCVKLELEKAAGMYAKLDEAFVDHSSPSSSET